MTDLDTRIQRGLIVQEYGDVSLLEYLAHTSRADTYEVARDG